MCKRISGLPLKQRNARSLDLTILAVFALAPLAGCIGMSRPPSVSPPPLGSPARAAPQQHVTAIKPKKTLSPRDARTTTDADDPIRVASIDPESLLGLDPDSVKKRLGTPARMEDSALSREWVYAAPGCSFRIFFYPNVNSTTFHALKYSSAKDGGESADSSDACVHRILTARNNAD